MSNELKQLDEYFKRFVGSVLKRPGCETRTNATETKVHHKVSIKFRIFHNGKMINIIHKISITVFCVVTLLSSCFTKSDNVKNSSNDNLKNSKKDTLQDSIQNAIRYEQKLYIFDSIPVYADVDIKGFTLDSIMAEVSFINDWDQSIWLYKPILPTDSLIENSFVLRLENDLQYVPHKQKSTNHQYLFGDQNFQPTIIPIINDNNLLELLPCTKLTFTINLSNHYDFKNLNKKVVKSIYSYYEMVFPFIKDKSHSLLNYKGKLIPTYFYIRPKGFKGWNYDSIERKFFLPGK